MAAKKTPPVIGASASNARIEISYDGEIYKILAVPTLGYGRAIQKFTTQFGDVEESEVPPLEEMALLDAFFEYQLPKALREALEQSGATYEILGEIFRVWAEEVQAMQGATPGESQAS